MYEDDLKTRVRRLKDSSEFAELRIELPTSVLEKAEKACDTHQCTMQSLVTEAVDCIVEALNAE